MTHSPVIPPPPKKTTWVPDGQYVKGFMLHNVHASASEDKNPEIILALINFFFFKVENFIFYDWLLFRFKGGCRFDPRPLESA